MAEYDEKNKELFDDNTVRIYSALDKIRSDKTLDTTKAELVRLTGLNRNTFRPLGPRGWVGDELDEIAKNRKKEAKQKKYTKKQQEDNLQSLLDQSKLEILHWYTQYSQSEREAEKLKILLKRDNDSLEWYKAELNKERESKKVLEEKISFLESLIDKQ
ncbi:hypothetical protein [Vibrio lentus]|uniref:hypothetical protein n=1 Tax=Vibrio lentus TaxID=136468 RepID=UPI0040637BED